MKRLLIGLLLTLASMQAAPYPLDGVEYTGIQRLLGDQMAQAQAKGRKLPPGALLSIREIRLPLSPRSAPPFDAVTPDPRLQDALETLLAKRDPSYGAVVVDLSDPARIGWAGVRPDVRRFPGSINKVVTLLALFDSLARAFPHAEDRERILRSTRVTARDWVIEDEHEVPKYDAATGTNRLEILLPSDAFNLSEWIDHMISASANAAAAVVWREAMLLRHFGASYPVTDDVAEAFFHNTPKPDLTALSQRVNNDPLSELGLGPDAIQQGSLWTRTAKRHVPGLVSYATPRSLARLLFHIEEGRAVDAWSSLEMKRYLYMTKRRYRYAYAPELAGAAVYFKSGSYYACHAEPGFRCGKYMGNTKNFMNVVVLVEWPGQATRYLVSLMSNVLKINSAWDHARIAVAIEEAIRTRRAAPIKDEGTDAEKQAAGNG